MQITVETEFPGIQTTVLEWNARDRACLLRAADLLAHARERVGPETPTGEELGIAEMWVRECMDDTILDTKNVEVTL